LCLHHLVSPERRAGMTMQNCSPVTMMKAT
jgi:hypothetical protein